MPSASQAFAPRGRNPFIPELAGGIVQHLQRVQEREEPDYPVPETATIAAQQAVRFEVERFRLSNANRIIVDEFVSEIFTKQISEFAFRPDPSWDVDPFVHSDYTICLVLSIPVSLRNIHRSTHFTGAITARDTLAWISEIKDAICPYICPATP